jgi:hypothetical protein
MFAMNVVMELKECQYPEIQDTTFKVALAGFKKFLDLLPNSYDIFRTLVKPKKLLKKILDISDRKKKLKNLS